MTLAQGVVEKNRANVTPVTVSRRFTGAIGGKIWVDFTLNINGTDISGTEVYRRVGKTLFLKGKVDSADHFKIEERYPKDKLTGFFEGDFSTNFGKMTGYFSKPDGSQLQPFELLDAAATREPEQKKDGPISHVKQPSALERAVEYYNQKYRNAPNPKPDSSLEKSIPIANPIISLGVGYECAEPGHYLCVNTWRDAATIVYAGAMGQKGIQGVLEIEGKLIPTPKKDGAAMIASENSGILTVVTLTRVWKFDIAKEHFISSKARIPTDLNGDGVVNAKDLHILKMNMNNPAAGSYDLQDLNRDGIINELDVKILKSNCARPNCAV